MRQILIIENDALLRSALGRRLGAEGFAVLEADAIEDGRNNAQRQMPDAIMLQLGMFGAIDAIRGLRDWYRGVVIGLAHSPGEARMLDAFEAGADDFLALPFSLEEMSARLRAALRRMAQEESFGLPRISTGELEIDLAAYRVSRRGETVHLTPLEFKLLAKLAGRLGRVVLQGQLLREIWGPYAEDYRHYLRIYIAQLRRKLEANPARPEYLFTENGIGYRLAELPPRRQPEEASPLATEPMRARPSMAGGR
ncbi:winged helix-turn-helix domain-containing protein [Paludibacterium yongneupense]|uniref:winged helix-turn-helix domain-containing protein n=1 Tax=Paludibacterium yongneupense TaxID=400061 RepID=UPI00041ECB15|nr:winged helix-turn-helix domain-containing protein [Paludibacterium yongneupense]